MMATTKRPFNIVKREEKAGWKIKQYIDIKAVPLKDSDERYFPFWLECMKL